VDEWSIIEKKIPSMDLIFNLDRERMESAGVGLTDAQRRLATLVDGERTVEDLAEVSGLGEFDAGKALFGLVQAGFAFRAGRRAEQEPGEAADLDEARNLGVAFYDTAMLEDADREFRRVLQSDPHDVTARHYLALISLRAGNAAEAVRRLSSLLESAGPRVGVYLNLAYALRLQRRHTDALRVLAQARKSAPDDPRIRLAEGATRLFSGDTEAAESLLDEYRTLSPPDVLPPATWYYCAGLVAAVGGRMEEAEALLEEGLGAHPSSPPLHLLAGNVAERRTDMAAAERAYQQAAEEDPTLAQAHRNLGDLAHRRGVEQEALEHYRRAAEIDPELGDELYIRLAELYYRRKERQEAIRSWQRALELNPGNEVARSHLEVVAGARG